ncbi:MAG TPA: hypothetical protein PKH96_07955, partial [Gemmatimonadaceae bacterium]|nr:hypothetical protein [Gemmatimonadaceae bacterium]
KSWALWNPGSRYAEFVGALRTARGTPSPIERSGWTAPQGSLPRERLSKVIAARERRARADSVAAATVPGATTPAPPPGAAKTP